MSASSSLSSSLSLLSDGHASEDKKGRLVVISNRLPISFKRPAATPNDVSTWTFQLSGGGLVAALSGVQDTMNFLWVGWAGDFVEEPLREAFERRLFSEFDCLPVHLDPGVADLHYNGFSNSVLWPLFHYLPDDVQFTSENWAAYKAANREFARSLSRLCTSDDLFWIHDYHLLLLPALVRQDFPRARVGFFLHIPFPSSELYRVLPVRESLLEGILEANVIGFHTFDYASHFRSACTRILSLSTTPESVAYKGAERLIGAFPVGINPSLFTEGLRSAATQAALEQLRARLKPSAQHRVLLGIDRLDYVKGLPHKLAAFEQFLIDRPDWRDRVTLVQIAVPTRPDVVEYQNLRSSVFELVGRIDAVYGTLQSCPVLLLNQSVSFAQLCALYRLADVCLVTSLRDGMNLVAYEYIACQSELHGTLILSEFTGAARSLSGAVIVNPWNIKEVADAIHYALDCGAAERAAKHRSLYSYVTTQTSAHWGSTFVSTLRHVHIHRIEANPLQLPAFARRLKLARRLLLLVDDDGTLAPYQADYLLSKPEPCLLRRVAQLAALPNVDVVITSGRDRATVDKWFAGMPVAISAEHGYFYRPANADQWQRDESLRLMDAKTRELVLSTFNAFQESTPGSFVEVKDSHLTWHYRKADPEYGQWQALEIREHLEVVLNGRYVDFHMGDKVVEVRPKGMNKAMILRKLALEPYDLVVYVGSDHDIFVALNKHSSAGRSVDLIVVNNRRPTGCTCDLKVLERSDVDRLLTLMVESCSDTLSTVESTNDQSTSIQSTNDQSIIQSTI